MFTQNGTVLSDSEAGKALAQTIVAELTCNEEVNLPKQTHKRIQGTDAEASDAKKRRKIPVSVRKNVAIGEPLSQASMSSITPTDDSWIELVFAHETFCPTHHDFSNSRHIDHVQPWKNLRDRKTTILAFVNQQNESFKKAFIENAKNYFKIDNQRIVATEALIKMIDTHPDNLFSLCPKCNGQKSDLNPQDWFENNPFFGKAFIVAIKNAGGVHRGAIFDRVYKDYGNKTVELAFSGNQLELFAGQGQGLGLFAKEWWKNNFYDVYLEQHRLRNNLYLDMARTVKEVSYYRGQAKHYFDKEGDKSEKGKKYSERAQRRFDRAAKRITSVVATAKSSLEKRRTSIFNALLEEDKNWNDVYQLLSCYTGLDDNLRQKIKEYAVSRIEQPEDGTAASQWEACIKHIENNQKLPHALELKALAELTKILVVVLDSAARVINAKEDLSMDGDVLFVQHNTSGTFSMLRPKSDASHVVGLLRTRYRHFSTSTASSTTESTNDDADDMTLREFLQEEASYNAWSMTRSYKYIARLSRLICEEKPLKKKIYDLLKGLSKQDRRANSDDWHNVAEKFEAFVTNCAELGEKKSFDQLKVKLREFFKEQSPRAQLIQAEKAKIEAEKAKIEAEKAKIEAEKAKIEAENRTQEERRLREDTERNALKDKQAKERAEEKIKTLYKKELEKLAKKLENTNDPARKEKIKAEISEIERELESYEVTSPATALINFGIHGRSGSTERALESPVQSSQTIDPRSQVTGFKK